jgi:hypothetical protein
MGPHITIRSGTTSSWARSWTIAAILLVLNWTAPGYFQLHPVFDLHDAAPGVSSGERASQPGNLPRLQARTVTCEASVPKAPHGKFKAGSQPYALLPTAPVVTATESRSIVPSVGPAARPTIAARVFDARAPPRLIA